MHPLLTWLHHLFIGLDAKHRQLHEELLELGQRPVALVLVLCLLPIPLEEADEEVLAEDGPHGARRWPGHLLHQQRDDGLVQADRQVDLHRAVSWLVR